MLLVTCLFYYSRNRLRYFSSKGVCTLPPVPFLGNLTAVTLGRENFVEAIAAGYDAFKDQRYLSKPIEEQLRDMCSLSQILCCI